MEQSAFIFAQVFYAILFLIVVYFQRKEITEHYKDALKAFGLTLIIPLCFISYAELFPATLDDDAGIYFIWFPGIPILQIVVYFYCLYVYKSLRVFLATLFVGEAVALLFIYFIYTMMVTGDWI